MWLDSPMTGGQREDVPEPDPIPSPNLALKRRAWRIARLLALLSVAIAGIAVILVTRGAGEVRASLVIATFLGIGFTVFVGSGLMALVFLSASSGHDQQAGARHNSEKDKDDRH